MKKLLILHPYSQAYTEIYACLDSKHSYTILTDSSKATSFEKNQPSNVDIVYCHNYPHHRQQAAENILSSSRFDAILALDEFDVLLAAQLRETFHISGQTLAEATLFRNKELMTKKVEEVGFRVPFSQKARSYSELKTFLQVRKDIIVKPSDGAGSVDTFHVKEADDLTRFATPEFWDQHSILLQEYIYADIYHIDGLVYQGNLIYCEPSQYLYNPLLIKKGCAAAAVSLDHTAPKCQQLIDYATKLVQSLYPGGTFLFHLEVFYKDEDIIFLEIASRMGGARIRQNLEFKLGHNPLKLLLLSICGEKLPPLPKDFPNTGWLLTAKKEGKLVELPILTEQVKQTYSIFDFITYVTVGQHLKHAFHSADAIIGLSNYGSNFEETKTALLQAEKWANEHTRYDE